MVALKAADVPSFLARPDRSYSLVLVFGPDAGLVRERTRAVLTASIGDLDDPFSLVRLSGDEIAADPARLMDEAGTMPLVGGRRAVWVKAGARSFVNAVEALLAAPPADCRVVIEAGDLKRNAPLRLVCERARGAAAIACYADGERELARLIDDELRAAKLKIAPQARTLLTSLLGGDRQLSRNEISKLALFASGKDVIEVDDVIAVTADASALALDDVIDAAFAGKLPDLAAQLARARAADIPSGTMLSAALRHVTQLHQVRLAIEAGAAPEQALGRHFPGLHFRRKPLVDIAVQTWSSARLSRAMGQLWDAARDARLQSVLAGPIAERALLSVASAARQRR